MPRLSKIRLTGCKYEGFKKQHENSIFDLTKDGDADHTLFTLYNGGGKGVMMQLIFQLLLPETKWGKNDGNKVISMFYDQRNNLNPYTFHVALEWVLDTVPEKRLITGIAMKSKIKNTSTEEDEKTGLSYFLYTYEHDNNGYFNMENLPLYDESTGEGIDLDEFEKFIDDNKRDFIKYSQSSVRRNDGEYYRYLGTKGIYRSEWKILKTINKSEGGVGDYFTKSSDNKSIFDNVIIPAITENIRNYSYDDGDSLINMFKSNLSITKDLPILIKREGSYKELLVGIKPLIENADSGSRFMDQRNRILDEGNDIYHILKNQESIVDKDIEKWEIENENAKIEGKELSFKKDNLYYNKEKLELEDKEKEAIKLGDIFKEKSKEIEEKQEELLLYEINTHLFEKRKTEDNIKSKSMEKERLVKTLDIEDIRGRANELDDEIDQEWNKTKSNWLNTQNEYQGYMNYINQILEENKFKKKVYETKKIELEKEVNIFEIRKANLAKDKENLGDSYDFMRLTFPERIVEDLNIDKKKIEEDMVTLSNDTKLYKERSSILNDSINRLKYHLENESQNANSLKSTIVEQEEYEIDISRRVVKQLLESYEGELLDHNWFSYKLQKIETMKESKKKSLEDIQRTIWEKNIDKSLNKEEYFIANKDIVLVKEEIEKMGIHVETGTEYLRGLEEKERLDTLKDYPGFLYSIVIGNQKEWELIEKNINTDLFLNNMVPIYIRTEMLSISKDIFATIKGKSYELIDDEKYLNWKDNMEREFQSLSQTENSLKSDMKNIDDIREELMIISKRDTAYILNQKLRELESSIMNLTEEIRINEEERLSIDSNITSIEFKIAENENFLENLILSIKDLEVYIGKIEDLEKEKQLILKIQQDLDDINKDISNIDDDNENMIEKQDRIKDSYNKWELQVDSIVRDIKLISKDISFEYKENSGYRSFNIPNFSIAVDILNALIKERKALEEDIASKNSSIAVLDAEINILSDLLINQIRNLKIKAKNWEDYQYLMLPIDEINMIIDEIKKNIQMLNIEKNNAKSSLDTINGNIGVMRKSLNSRETQILKEHKRAAIVLETMDIDSAINIVDRDIISNREYLISCVENLEGNRDRKNKLWLNLTRIKDNYELDLTKGKMDEILKSKVVDNPDLVVEDWLRRSSRNKFEINKTVDEGESFRGRFIKLVGLNLEEEILKDKIITAIKEANIDNFRNNKVSFESMENHFERELLSFSRDKEKAENAMRQWTNRASIHIMRIVGALKTMVSNMNYSNEQGYIFPLVKLKGDERLPKEESEITYLLDEYFIQAISKVLESNEDIDSIDDRTLKDLMGDKILFSKALQGRYPTLLVYKMTEKNEFKYAKPRDEYYTTWEAINKGEGDLPEGSGGQTLSVNTFVIMMIMNFQKKHIGNENPWTVLILDNPFGKASARHVLDPIFEIANKLNFQLITFAAPEIIKVEISERFPIFWELKVEDGKVVHGGRIVKY